MNDLEQAIATELQLRETTRRQFFQNCGLGIGAAALRSLLSPTSISAASNKHEQKTHFPAKAKAVIFLFMAGAPSQLDLISDKPLLRKHNGEPPPPSYLEGKRFAFLKGNETLLGSSRKFARYGESGQEISDLLPHHQKLADEACWIHSMYTDVFNHGPAKLFVNTGSPQPGRPSMDPG